MLLKVVDWGMVFCESSILTVQVREYLEKHYEETSGDATAKLALKALTETVEASSKNIEVAVTTKDAGQCAPTAVCVLCLGFRI